MKDFGNISVVSTENRNGALSSRCVLVESIERTPPRNSGSGTCRPLADDFKAAILPVRPKQRQHDDDWMPAEACELHDGIPKWCRRCAGRHKLPK